MVVTRREHWQEVYEGTAPDGVSWYQREPTVSLQLITNARIATNDPVIDVGGGVSPLAGRLLQAHYTDITVLDISEAALAHARAQLGTRADAVNWVQADVTEFVPPHPYQLWHDRAVLHFLTARADRRKYVNVLKQSLRPAGQVIIGAFAVGGPKRCSGLTIRQYDAHKIQDTLGSEFELVEQRSEAHVTPRGAIQQFAWFRLQRTGKVRDSI